MAHHIVYDHIPGREDDFVTLRVVWEPYTNRISLRFRNRQEAASGLVGTPKEIIDYLDMRAKSGSPWDQEAPRAARRRIAALIGEDIEALSDVD